MPPPQNTHRIFYPSYYETITLFTCVDPKHAFGDLMFWLYNKPNLPDFWIDKNWSTNGPPAHANHLYYVPDILRGKVSVLCFQSCKCEEAYFMWVRCSLRSWLNRYMALKDTEGMSMMVVLREMDGRKEDPESVRRMVYDKVAAWLEWLEDEEERRKWKFPDVELNMVGKEDQVDPKLKKKIGGTKARAHGSLGGSEDMEKDLE